MRTKCVIFDKDGTILDFEAFWIPTTEAALKDILREFSAPQELLPVIGRRAGISDGEAAIDGVLCGGTDGDAARLVADVFAEHGIFVEEEILCKALIEALRRRLPEGKILPACENIGQVFARLKETGVKAFLVTSDREESTKECLRALGIAECFEEVICDDGVTPAKPDPYSIRRIAEKYGWKRSEMCMAGDTLTDMRFAKNGGIRGIGVAQSEKNRKRLAAEADSVIADISEIFSVLD